MKKISFAYAISISMKTLIWLIIAVVGLPGCTRIIVPSSDSTPPTVALTLLAEDVEVRGEGTAQTIEVDESDRYTIMVFGRDEDSGVRRAWIEGQVSVSCVLASVPGVMRHPALPLRGHDSDVMEEIVEPGGSAHITLTQALDWRASDWLFFGGCSPFERDFLMEATYVGYAENQMGGAAHTDPLRLVFAVEEEAPEPETSDCEEGLPCTIQPWQCRGRPGFEATGTTVCIDGLEQCRTSMPEDYCSIPGGRCGRGEGQQCDSENLCAPGLLCVGAGGDARCYVGHCDIPIDFCWTEDEVGDPSLVCEEIH